MIDFARFCAGFSLATQDRLSYKSRLVPYILLSKYFQSLGSRATRLMDPSAAALLKDAHGFNTKASLGQWFSNNIERTVASHLGNGVQIGMTTSMAAQGLEPYGTRIKLPPETMIKPFNEPKIIQIVVVGGKIQTTWFVTDFMLGRGFLVDDWR